MAQSDGDGEFTLSDHEIHQQKTLAAITQDTPTMVGLLMMVRRQESPMLVMAGCHTHMEQVGLGRGISGDDHGPKTRPGLGCFQGSFRQ